jgi:hypothetical protein
VGFPKVPAIPRHDARLVCCEGLKIAKRKRSAKKLYEPHGNRPDEAAPSRNSVPRFQIHAHTEMRVLYRAFWLSASPFVSRPQILTDSLLSFCRLRARHPSQLVIVFGRFYSRKTSCCKTNPGQLAGRLEMESRSRIALGKKANGCQAGQKNHRRARVLRHQLSLTFCVRPDYPRRQTSS